MPFACGQGLRGVDARLTPKHVPRHACGGGQEQCASGNPDVFHKSERRGGGKPDKPSEPEAQCIVGQRFVRLREACTDSETNAPPMAPCPNEGRQWRQRPVQAWDIPRVAGQGRLAFLPSPPYIHPWMMLLVVGTNATGAPLVGSYASLPPMLSISKSPTVVLGAVVAVSLL